MLTLNYKSRVVKPPPTAQKPPPHRTPKTVKTPLTCFRGAGKLFNSRDRFCRKGGGNEIWCVTHSTETKRNQKIRGEENPSSSK